MGCSKKTKKTKTFYEGQLLSLEFSGVFFQGLLEDRFCISLSAHVWLLPFI